MHAGYVSFCFTARPGKMYPADCVLGYVNNDGSGALVGSFYVTCE